MLCGTIKNLQRIFLSGPQEENPPYTNVYNLFSSAEGLSREVCLSQQGLCQESVPCLMAPATH